MTNPTICDCGPYRSLRAAEDDNGRPVYRCQCCHGDQPRCAFCTRAATLHDGGEWLCVACARECAAELKETLPMAPQSMRELVTGRDPQDVSAVPAFDVALWARRSA